MKAVNRIFVIGHPAAGKAVFSKALAEQIGYQFIDADIGMEHIIGLHIKDIVGQEGLNQYEQTQQLILKSLSKRTGIVAGLDCPIGNAESVLDLLRKSVVIFLKTSLETQVRRSNRHQPLVDKKSYPELLGMLQNERNDFYHSISDFVISADEGDVNRHVNAVLAFFHQNELDLLEPVNLTKKDLFIFKKNTDIPIRITDQQAICLKYLSKGLTAKEIARDMSISHRTVEIYIAQLIEKLGCDSSKDLINLYLSKC